MTKMPLNTSTYPLPLILILSLLSLYHLSFLSLYHLSFTTHSLSTLSIICGCGGAAVRRRDAEGHRWRRMRRSVGSATRKTGGSCGCGGAAGGTTARQCGRPPLATTGGVGSVTRRTTGGGLAVAAEGRRSLVDEDDGRRWRWLGYDDCRRQHA